MSKEEIAERAGLTLDAWEQGEPIDEISFADDIRNLIAFAIANKAAEEGELPSTPPSSWDEWALDKSRTFMKRIEEVNHPRAMLISAIHCLLIQAMEYADRASRQDKTELPPIERFSIYEDHGRASMMGDDDGEYVMYSHHVEAIRASRQVANKAEVDLSSLEKFTAKEISERPMFPGIRFVKLAHVEELLATPPATTGASTAIELDAYDAGLLPDFGGGDVNWWRDYIRAELDRAHDFYQSQVVGSVGASTVLTDERIDNLWHEACLKHLDLDDSAIPDFARAIERETLIAALIANDKKIDPVAAQAGQVAVPETEGNLDLSGITSMVLQDRGSKSVIVRFGQSMAAAKKFLDQFGTLVLNDRAAPSPAKESK